MPSTDNPLVLRTVNGRMRFLDVDNNFRNLMRFAGDWSAAEYAKNQVVVHDDWLWVANATTSDEPTLQSSQWDVISQSGVGVGAMGLSSSIAATSFGAGWNSVTEFDEVTLNDGRNTTIDLTTGSIAFNCPGVWEIDFQLYLSHDNSASLRTVNLRVVTTTGTAQVGRSYPLLIGKNEDASRISLRFLVTIEPSQVGVNHQIQLGGGSTVTSCVYESMNLHAKRVGRIAIPTGTSAGVASASAAGIAPGVGTAEGTVSFIAGAGMSKTEAAGTAAGEAATAGVGQSISEADGTITGTSSATAVGTAV